MSPRAEKRSAPASSDRQTRSSKVAKTDSKDVATAQSNNKSKKGKKVRPMPSSAFKSAALPLHIHITHTPPTIDVPSSAEPSAQDVGHIASITMLPCDFGTGSYGWKGQKRTVVQLMGGEGDGKEKVQVMFSINAVVVGSKDAEADIIDEPPAEVEEAEADVEKDDAADAKAEKAVKDAAAAV
ncbi:hypothetical protein DACRYDRAFT_75009 [Dacryopinax primogenitus]|uniref:Uncharacterized protein n=1 Tax=Dacryopinax primogenitus (strain DJM 731) TaxID=1858805 RepID=M5GA51_DACPD|nr:uncharacterized protein DACRYDRAFT_75009 [Dacryopinax primogenitus]EJU05684.1 hypothetical protein DACRYDRAFT_75009 [Dacryopinax primogenitus]